jgi:4a-hydroxytetrahydrobiopterin dehydratase
LGNIAGGDLSHKFVSGARQHSGDSIAMPKNRRESEQKMWAEKDGTLQATFATGSFTRGVDFIVALCSVAEAANHHPDVDLRYGTVSVALVTHDQQKITQKDHDLAAQIGELAHKLGIGAAAA